MSDDLRPKPVSWALTVHPTKAQAKSDQKTALEGDKESAANEPISHPFLALRIRSQVSNRGYLNSFLSYECSQVNANLDVLKYGLQPSSEFSEIVDSLDKVFDKNGSSLKDAALSMLKIADDFQDKELLAAMVLYLDPSFFVSEYLIPILEEDHYIQDLQGNKNFVVRVLSAYWKDDLKELFSFVDFKNVSKLNKLAENLAALPYPQDVMDALIEISNEKGDGANDIKNKIHRIVLLTLQKLGKENLEVPLSTVQGLYSSSIDTDISDGAYAILKDKHESDALEILIRLINDNSDDSYETRLRRFWAIHDLACLPKGNAAKLLKEFVLSSNDSFLVNYACYELGLNTGEEGKNALASIILKDASSERPSNALAFVAFMVKHRKEFADILKLVCSMQYADSTLANVYRNTEAAEFNKIQVDEKGCLTFSLYDTQPTVNVTDVFSMIGLETIIRWGLEDKSLTTKKNVLDLLEYAYKSNPRKISALINAQLEMDDPKTNNFLLGIADVKEAAKRRRQ